MQDAVNSEQIAPYLLRDLSTKKIPQLELLNAHRLIKRTRGNDYPRMNMRTDCTVAKLEILADKEGISRGQAFPLNLIMLTHARVIIMRRPSRRLVVLSPSRENTSRKTISVIFSTLRPYAFYNGCESPIAG